MPAWIASRSSVGQLVDRGQDAARPSFGFAPALRQRVAVLREHVGEVRAHGVAEDDRVRDLHHRRLQVQGEQHALLLGVGDLLLAGTRRARAGA